MNNEELNLVEILKDVPEGTKLYSPIFGDVTFDEIRNYGEYRIHCYTNLHHPVSFTSKGIYHHKYDGECMLFPSKENRDWSTYKYTPSKPKLELKPYDKVLVRDNDSEEWIPTFYLCYDNSENHKLHPYKTIECTYWAQCIPYEGNEHRVGTTDMPKGGKE